MSHVRAPLASGQPLVRRRPANRRTPKADLLETYTAPALESGSTVPRITSYEHDFSGFKQGDATGWLRWASSAT